MTPQEFVTKWRAVALKERAAAQEHFLDLCRLVGHPTPAEDDPTGQRFAFEAGANKQNGQPGWADVWKRGFFAWEYKGKHADLKKAYDQLLQYRESLVNPPLLIVCDIDTIQVHTNFTNTIKTVIPIGLETLLTPAGMRNLRAIFYDPNHFKAEQTTEGVTRQAAEEFARLADHLRNQGQPTEKIAHFSIRLLFCLFAEDIELLPRGLFARLIELGRQRPQSFDQRLRQLFGAMATGGIFGDHDIRHFNGGLFDTDAALPLDGDGLTILHRVAALDWSNIEPSIFGTLFERSLDPGKRSQLGAHYTSKEDIGLIVEPVVMAPLRRAWEALKQQGSDLAQKRDAAGTPQLRSRYHNELERLLTGFMQRLAALRVLDPACGSGNFLYVALRMLLDLWKEVAVFAGTLGLPLLLPLPGFAPSPEQLYGIELNAYAYELAQATVWIGYIQWLHENGYGVPSEPILKPLHNIQQMDAILAYDAQGKPVEPAWPAADVIVGNPPFLGDKKMRAELEDKYVDDLRYLYFGRVAGGADLVTYWFEKARYLVEVGQITRVGLLATQSIRVGLNRRVLEGIKRTGDIFYAYSDRPWILDGADVRVSIVGFDNGTETRKQLDGMLVNRINPNLSSDTDVTSAVRLFENQGIVFIGTQKTGSFDINSEEANKMLNAKGNPNGRSNSDVVKLWVNATDVTKRLRNMWIIDFGTNMSVEDASQYELPFEYVLARVKPSRDVVRRANHREKWWLFGETRPGMREAIKNISRYIATPRVSKHRIFVWLNAKVIPDSRLAIFARADDYFWGILHSSVHEMWSLANSSWHGVGNDPTYNSLSCFETFPFPWPPGQESADDPRVQAIAQAAKDLVEKRDNWLNPPGADAADLKKRTLTNLYNQHPTWLDLAHKKLDQAVLAAYGWADLLTAEGINEDEVLARLLALNLSRAQTQPVGQARLIADENGEEE
jgi:type II restriction/modification system DNA methylase subunit YeeA